jgi:hypothetical protein
MVDEEHACNESINSGIREMGVGGISTLHKFFTRIKLEFAPVHAGIKRK